MQDPESRKPAPEARSLVWAISGAVAGCAAGFIIYFLLATQGGWFFPVIPAAGLGLGRAWATPRFSPALGAACAVAGGLITLVVLMQLHAEGLDAFDGRDWLSVAFGALVAGWLGVGRRRPR
jgi:hypothetical protein